MYLLIPIQLSNDEHTDIFTFHYVSINSMKKRLLTSFLISFTFHYVSINSVKSLNNNIYNFNLHSTMYLLIHTDPTPQYL